MGNFVGSKGQWVGTPSNMNINAGGITFSTLSVIVTPESQTCKSSCLWSLHLDVLQPGTFNPTVSKEGRFSSCTGYRFHHPASPPSEHLSCHLDTPSSSLYIHSHSQCPGLDLCHLSWMVRASQQPLQFVLIWRLLAKLEQTVIETSIKKVSKQREGWGQCRAENKELPSDFQWKFGYWSMFEAEDVDV